MKKTIKKEIEYDETNVPGGYCMSGKGMTKTEAIQMAQWVKEQKEAIKAKQAKSRL